MQSNRAKLIDHSIHLTLLVCVSVTVLTTCTVLMILGKESLQFFSQVSIIDFLFGTKWEPLLEPKSFGVLPLVCGTLIIVVGSIALAVPAGLIIAAYLNEFASSRLRSIVKPTLEILAGIPTVVFGYFALSFVTPIIKIVLPGTQVFNALSAAIVVGIMILPMISSLCDDAFRAVPSGLRDGAYALGATPYEVLTQIVLPAAKSRVGASVVLAVSRAIGETMAVTLAAGATPILTLNPLESVQTMTAYIVQVSLGDTPAGGIEYQTCFAVATLLFVMTLTMNMLGNHFVFAERRKGV